MKYYGLNLYWNQKCMIVSDSVFFLEVWYTVAYISHNIYPVPHSSPALQVPEKKFVLAVIMGKRYFCEKDVL